MPKEITDRLLLTVGVFETSLALDHAIEDLHAEGFGAREMCLVGTSAAFEDMVHAPFKPLMPRSGKPLHQRTRHLLPWLSDDLKILGTSGILLRTLLAQATAERDEHVAPSNRLIQELREKLGSHLEEDAIALLVSASDHHHQNQASRVLLRHSVQTVQSYAMRVTVLPREAQPLS